MTMPDAPPPLRRRGQGTQVAVLLITAAAFLVRRPPTFTFRPDRWWAVFLFVPLATALLRPAARVGTRRALLTGALSGVAVGIIFLFGIPWSAGWPLLLVAAALASLA